MAIGEKDPKRLGARISRAARGWVGWSAERLALELGKTDRKYVQRRESGEIDWDPAELAYIAELTKVPPWFTREGFWKGQSEPPAEPGEVSGPIVPPPPSERGLEGKRPDTEVG